MAAVRLAFDEADVSGARTFLRFFRCEFDALTLAQDLAGLLTVERLADRLSALADLVLDVTMEEVWRVL